MASPNTRHWPKFKDPETDRAFRLVYNGVFDCQNAFAALMSKAVLHATIAGGAITAVSVIESGKYIDVPTITAIGGGGTGAQFTAVLDANGGIRMVTINAGGSGFTSPPYLQVTGS